MKILKRTMAILLVMIISFSVVSVGAQAVGVAITSKLYGYMIPVKNDFSKSVSTVYLYGNYDHINFSINSYTSNTDFYFEVYSDPEYTKLVYSDHIFLNYGDYKYSPCINMIGKFSSKTYYAVTYSAAATVNKGTVLVSQPSLKTFKIVVNRVPKYNQQIVGLKSLINTVHGPQISWYKVSDSTVKYNIYRRDINGTQWKIIGCVNSSTHSFIDRSVKYANGGYVYTVRGVDKNGTLTRYHYRGLETYFVQAPVVTCVTMIADNFVYVKWNKVSSCDSYLVYERENGGAWKLLAETFDTCFYDIGLKNGSNYQYTIRAKKKFPGNVGNRVSSYYAGKGVDYIPAPKLNPVKFTEKGMMVSWNSVQGAEKYAVYRKSLEANSTWKILGRVDGSQTSYIDKTAVEDNSYRYTVRSEGATNQGSYYSAGACYVKLTQPEVTVTDVIGKNLKLEWDKDEYATYYYLMCNDGSGWKKHYGTSGCINYFSYLQTACKEYKFSVMPVFDNIEGSYKTDVESVITFPITYLNNVVYEDYVRLSWKNIKADSYNVYRKLKGAPDTDYELITNTTGTAYSDYSAEDNVTYIYCVRAIYHSVEQNMNIPYATVTKYSADKYIKDFRVVKNEYYKNGSATVKYEFEIEKTPEGESLNTVVYAFSTKGWVRTDSSDFGAWWFEFYGDKPTFYAVAYDDNGKTPIDACMTVVEEELFTRPVVRLNAINNGLMISWEAIDGAVEYIVEDLMNGIYKKVVVAGSDSYYAIIDSSEIKMNKGAELRVTAVDSKGNSSAVIVDGVSYCSTPKLLSVKNSENGNTIYYSGTRYDNQIYHIFRKAPGDKNWTRIGYTTGSNYTDNTAIVGVKYTYTVRVYDYENKYYASYYDTAGL